MTDDDRVNDDPRPDRYAAKPPTILEHAIIDTTMIDAITTLLEERDVLRRQRAELTDAWRECFGLVVCRNGSKADQETVNRFWVLMNRAAGTGH